MICNERGKNSGDGIDLVAGFALQNIYSGDLSFRGTGWLWGGVTEHGRPHPCVSARTACKLIIRREKWPQNFGSGGRARSFTRSIRAASPTGTAMAWVI